MSDDLLVTEPRPGVAQVTLNRPAKRNALSARLMAAYDSAHPRARMARAATPT